MLRKKTSADATAEGATAEGTITERTSNKGCSAQYSTYLTASRDAKKHSIRPGRKRQAGAHRVGRVPALEIKWSLFGYFIGFSVFIIALLWIFQILFLDSFYYSIVKGRLKHAADEIVLASVEDNFEGYSEDLTVKYGLCVIVYGTDGSRKLSLTPDNSCVINRLTIVTLNNIYKDTLQKGSEMYLTYTAASPSVISPDTSSKSTGGASSSEAAVQGGSSLPDRLVYVRVAKNQNGEELMVLLDCAISPVDSTVSTLMIQLSVISVILILTALLLAFFISRRVSRPICAINKQAKTLATGDYSANFMASGYREISELAGTLNYAASGLSKVDNLQKELIANVSHDLRTPLTMIIGYGEVIRDIEEENTPENIQVIIDEAKRLSGLVDDLLEISRCRSGTEKINIESFDLCAALRETVRRYTHMMEKEGFVFSLECPDSAAVMADKKRIHQVIYNLMNNAINYSGDSRDIFITAKVSDGSVRVNISDMGEGIAREDLVNIWKRYYKADKTHKRSTVGSGLGLSIVREILELHGARYGVESTIGLGSSFWFELDFSEK